ncbi:carboxymuconolactone decarboxylase family protein [Schlesneria paludicola]|uniref:carboxymuconolactone decarboxylase family protein n=1 Tax=Schlesneria paludicola TaxID=360056 RepID=UPI00029A69B9|nr:carboxymuconolactone decarboxylase family protein [Schlesneria paludicola]
MQSRLDYTKAAPGTLRALFGLEVYLHGCGLDHGLLHLIKLRASQINGCAYCIDMHSKDARAAGETEQRLYLLDAWREAPIYTDRERAAFAWTEAVTKVTDGHVPDEVFAEVREQFNDKELADLTMSIAAINAWNRMAISFRMMPGAYQPGQFAHLFEKQHH